MSLPNALMVGSGEYTTGYVHDAASRSDKSAGVVALTLFDLRQSGYLDRLYMAATNGGKFNRVRRHLQEVIGHRYGLETGFVSYPDDNVEQDPQAYLKALESLSKGDIVIIFTPDDTHFEIAMASVSRGCHVLIAKPMVKTLEEHRQLAACAAEQDVLVAMEVHKRWDPIYADARNRIRSLGDFSFFSAYMSQPKTQLDSFRSWAGRSSDISYYLNAHHVDFNHWAVQDFARPLSVTALASTGCSLTKGINTEDTITLTTQWQNIKSGHLATAIYTASWIAPSSDVHSQQRFFYMGHQGELQVDQAHRGYSQASDQSGFQSPNPLFMSYTPDEQGRFAGQQAYGYRSIADFVHAAGAINRGVTTPEDLNRKLATVHQTMPVTAVLEAGRRSLDEHGRKVGLSYDAEGNVQDLC